MVGKSQPAARSTPPASPRLRRTPWRTGSENWESAPSCVIVIDSSAQPVMMTRMQLAREFLSVDETAALTGLSSATVRRRVADGTFPSILVGRRRLVRADVIERLGKAEQ